MEKKKLFVTLSLSKQEKDLVENLVWTGHARSKSAIIHAAFRAFVPILQKQEQKFFRVIERARKEKPLYGDLTEIVKKVR